MGDFHDDGSGESIWMVVWETLLNCWWGQVGAGVFLFVVAGLLGWLFAEMDFARRPGAAADFMDVVAIATVKWATVLLIVLLGMFVTGVGIRNLIVLTRRRKKK
jgi:hypothetical protein